VKQIPFYDLNSWDETNARISSSSNIHFDQTIPPEDANNFLSVIACDVYIVPFLQGLSAPNKIAWLLEPPSIINRIYEFVAGNINQFQCVFTHCRKFVELFPNKAVYYPFGTTSIKVEDVGYNTKTDKVCMIVSDKKVTAGHKFRHEVVEKFKDKITRLKCGGEREYKLPYLKNCMYSIEIENGQFDGYFSEKLIDCFLTGTVPIYCGDPTIGQIFDTEGMLSFNSIDELEVILNSDLSQERYHSMKDAISNNFYTAHNYLNPQNFIKAALVERGLI